MGDDQRRLVLVLDLAALAQPIAVAIHFEDMHMMGQAIQDGAGEAFGAEDFGPFIERQVGSLTGE